MHDKIAIYAKRREHLVNEKELLKSPEIMTAQFAAGRYQVIGTHVEEVFQTVQKTLGEVSVEEPKKKRGFLNSVIEIITKNLLHLFWEF